MGTACEGEYRKHVLYVPVTGEFVSSVGNDVKYTKGLFEALDFGSRLLADQMGYHLRNDQHEHVWTAVVNINIEVTNYVD